MKGLFFDKTLSFNASACFYAFTDMQIAKTDSASGGAFGSRLENAGKSEVTGIEVELQWVPTHNLSFEAQLGYLDSEIKDFSSVNEIDPCAGGTSGCNPLDSSTFIEQQFSGNRLVQAPEYTANLQGKYQFDLDNGAAITIGAGGYYRSQIFFTPFNSINVKEDSITIYNANIKYIHPGEKFELNIWGKNLTDEEYYGSKFPVSTTYIIMGTLAAPSTYGVTLSYNF
jgi:iron complex outermembrane receptor protein